MNAKKSILVFGGGNLQLSIIKKCKQNNLFTVVIDPNPHAEAKKYADAFEVVNGNDYDDTCAIIEKHAISGIITAATDKPLLMMARIAEKYNFPFFSLETAQNSTDKFLMKKKFQEYEISFADGVLIEKINPKIIYPVIIKPRDNSGSRGVIYCKNQVEAEEGLKIALSHSKMKTVLVEEFIEGSEYSIETLHHNRKNKIIQYTEKITSNFPYNVELGHIAPSQLSESIKNEISKIIDKISMAFHFDNCVSHTELKIHSNKITVIETSPRLGGDFITSHLVPLSTGFDIEQALINIAMGKDPIIDIQSKINYAGVFYIQLSKGEIIKTNEIDELSKLNWVKNFEFILKEGENVPEIKSSLDRYGSVLLLANSKEELIQRKESIMQEINHKVLIN